MFLPDGTVAAGEAVMKTSIALLASFTLLTVTAGCNRSDGTTGSTAADTNNTQQNAAESTSKAWGDTKGAATNVWNATKDEATNVWNKTTNAVHSGGS